MGGTCAGCGDEVALHRGRPIVARNGSVALWCDRCTSPTGRLVAAPVPALAPPELAPPPVRRPEPRRSHLRPTALAGGLVIAATVGLMITTPRRETIAGPVINPAVASPPGLPGAAGGFEVPGFDDLPPPPAHDVDSLEELRPTLRDWAHPVTGTDERMPTRRTARFGAGRDGVARTECGAGHCGVDLAGPIGRPVVAVAAGIVVRIDHTERGRDGHSGRYVRLEHPDGVFTSYMHLDAIVTDLRHGDMVDAGQVVGTLGKTGILRGPQHLHFALELAMVGQVLHVDPAPFLDRAEILPIPAMADVRLVPAEPVEATAE